MQGFEKHARNKVEGFDWKNTPENRARVREKAKAAFHSGRRDLEGAHNIKIPSHIANKWEKSLYSKIDSINLEHNYDPAHWAWDHLDEEFNKWKGTKMEKKAFWDGFEKRALSGELLGRAGTKALQEALTAARFKQKDASKFLKKRISQGQKFHTAAAEKKFKQGESKGWGDSNDYNASMGVFL